MTGQERVGASESPAGDEHEEAKEGRGIKGHMLEHIFDKAFE